MSWEKVRLGDVTRNLDFRRKPLNSVQRDELKKAGGLYPYVGANNIQDYIDEYIFDEKILCISEDGGSWGANEVCSQIYNEKCWVNNHAHVLTSRSSVLLEYLMYYLNHTDLNRFITGATRGKLTKKALDNLEIPLPPLPIQEKIAAILDKADALRRKDQELLKKYDEFAQAIFIDMFGDPVRNEKGWEMKRLGELSNISSGSTPSRSNDDFYNGDISWVKTGEVSGKTILDTEEKISEEALKSSRCKIYPKGSLIIAMYGQGKTRGQVGVLGIEAATNQACAVIPPSEKMNYTYLFELLKQNYEDLRSLGRGGNQPNLNSGLIKNYEVINPPIALQEAFAKKIELINQIKAKINAEKSHELFQSLLQRAFEGELVI